MSSTNTATSRLKGKIALVTGASRGIGAAIARRLADEGADVAITYSASADKANALVEELKAKGVRAAAFKADQGDAAQVAQTVHVIAGQFGTIDILVNNAALFIMGAINDSATDFASLDRQHAVNVTGVLATVRAAVKYIGEGGRIITIGSSAADHLPFPGAADYAGTKAAVAAFGRGWARDLGSKGITVNTIQPGPIDTDMNPASGAFAPTQTALTALGRYGKPEEVAAAVAFLASPEAAFITGATLNVDGGVNA